MVTYADAEKLRGVRAQEPMVLSLYLPVPLDPVELRGLTAMAGHLMSGVRAEGAAGPGGGQVGRADRDAVLDAAAAHGREWLGHTVALFACEKHALFEALPLPGAVPERAVLATRPHVRPLLAALQRYPDYRVVIVDRRRAWLLAGDGGGMETWSRQSDEAPRSPGFGGWYGLESYRVQHRVIQLGERHYRDVATTLERAAGPDRNVPLVIGGHGDSVHSLLRALPPASREAFAGSFAADPHTLTPARIQELARPLVASYLARREQELAGKVLGEAPGRLAAVGLTACLAAVNEGAVDHLLVAHEDMIPGYACDRCGTLSTASDGCPDRGAAARAIPDLLEAMAERTLDGNGRVIMLPDAPFTAAARLRFPVPEAGARGGEEA
jgi:Bacterial archaeo-eukaryotic release factor family 10